MDTIEYYKLKDELSTLIRSEVAANASNERDLQQRYIGVALKVAAAGLAAAVLALGIFGIKSMMEINAAISAIPDVIKGRANEEIKVRFNESNPVAVYETLVLESAARSVTTALAAQIDRASSVVVDERASDVIARALTDQDVKNGAKLSIIYMLSTNKIRSVSPAIDQAVTTSVLRWAKDRSVAERALAKAVRYFTYRDQERFVGDMEKVYDLTTNLPRVVVAIARYGYELEKDYGGDLLKKLEQSPDPQIRYLLHIRNLKIKKTAQLDQSLIENVLSIAFEDSSVEDFTVSDVIDHASALSALSTDMSDQLLDMIRKFAVKLKAAPTLDRASSNASYVAFTSGSQSRISEALRAERYEILLGLAISKIARSLSESNGKFDGSITEELDFWLPRLSRSSDRKALVLMAENLNQTNFIVKDNIEISGRSTNRAIITTQKGSSGIEATLKWTTEMGEAKSAPVLAVADFGKTALHVVSQSPFWAFDESLE